MKVSIVGAGYVGLVSGACLAAAGQDVTCVDVKSDLVSAINAGESTIHEIGLRGILKGALEKRTLRATTDLASAIYQTDLTLVCVGTPTVGQEMDCSHIIEVSRAIGEVLRTKTAYHVVAVKSTVLPGTTENIVRGVIEDASGCAVGDRWGLCMNPEFLREGRAVQDFQDPDRIVIGAHDKKTAETVLRLYEPYDCPKLVVPIRTAEMIKYVSNSLFASLVSFSNEVANICSATRGVDAKAVWNGVHLDRRLTPTKSSQGLSSGITSYLWHGVGFGGSCFPKDVSAFCGYGKKVGVLTPLLDAVLATNLAQPLRLVQLLEEQLTVPLNGLTVAVLGLAFKPDTDDLRNSPALPIVTLLKDRGANVVVHDPIAMDRATQDPTFFGVIFAPDWQGALKNADACCVVTAWPEYMAIPPEQFRDLMRHPLVVDGRGIYEARAFKEAGVIWRGIGYTPDA